jgi:hypothetical protein
MRAIILSVLAFGAGSGSGYSCALDGGGGIKRSEKEIRQYWKKFSRNKNRRIANQGLDLLPSAKDRPWGGAIAEWKDEAILANSVSEALNDGWKVPGVQDVLVSVPMKMIPGKVPVQGSNYGNRPYGDGQTNALGTFGNAWTQKQPQLISTLVTLSSGLTQLKFRFHRSLVLSEPQVQFIYWADGKKREKTIGEMKKSAEGDFEFEWKPTDQDGLKWGDLYKNQIAYIRPKGWKDFFPVDFRDVAVPNKELLNQMPLDKQKLGIGTLLDPENVSVQGQNTSEFPFQKMGDPNFGKARLNAEKYFPVVGIHNFFFTENGSKIQTAVNDGATVVIPKGIAPFKMAYICFEPRNETAESLAGLPSGGGWHEIGDPAETVINSLENAPIVFGYANGHPGADKPEGSNYAYGLTDVTVVRKVFPGMSIVSSAGPTTLAEGYTPQRGHGPSQGRNYHWFVFNQMNYVCAAEWVHNCVPNEGNKIGTVCP